MILDDLWPILVGTILLQLEILALLGRRDLLLGSGDSTMNVTYRTSYIHVYHRSCWNAVGYKEFCSFR